MEIGEPKRVVTIEPIENPVPAPAPAREPEEPVAPAETPHEPAKVTP